MTSHKDDATKKLRAFIKQAQEELESFDKEDVQEKKESLETFIQENPLLAAGGALLAGYFLGRLFKRRRK